MFGVSNSQVAGGSSGLQFFDRSASRKLLREYSGVVDEDIDGHVETIKSKALEVCPYPCIRTYRFLDLSMMTMDVYQEVLQRTKSGETFLDLGCCFGQEIRQLVFDGAPSANTYGSDLHGGFFTVGYELFKDKDRLETTFIAADIFEDSSPLTEMAGQMNMVYTGDLFHLFGLEEQEKIAARVIQLTAAKSGSLIIGRQSGGEESGEFSRAGDKTGRKHFRHNPQSWKQLWDRIGERTGTSWSVDANLLFSEFQPTATEGTPSQTPSQVSKSLRYTIRRL